MVTREFTGALYYSSSLPVRSQTGEVGTLCGCIRRCEFVCFVVDVVKGGARSGLRCCATGELACAVWNHSHR